MGGRFSQFDLFVYPLFDVVFDRVTILFHVGLTLSPFWNIGNIPQHGKEYFFYLVTFDLDFWSSLYKMNNAQQKSEQQLFFNVYKGIIYSYYS